MKAVPDSYFTGDLAESHRLATVVSVNGVEIPIIDGSVTLDANSAIRGSVSLTVAPDDLTLELLVPDVPDSLLAPYGNEILVSRGIRRLGPGSFGGGLLPSEDLYPSTDLYPRDSGEWTFGFPTEDALVQLGIFRIDETSVEDHGDLGITVTGYDRSALIIDAVFEDAGQSPAGEYGVDLILGLIRDGYAGETPAYPDVVLADSSRWTTTSVTTTMPALAWEAGDDRWDFCQGVAEACNRRLYFDGQGHLVLEPRTFSRDPVLTVSEGEGGIMLGASKRWGRENACNRVVVTGESSGETPVRGVRQDDDPLSPTHYGGPFGKVTFSWSSEFVKTQTQAEDVAQNILDERLGTGQEIGFEALVHPGLEPYDTVLVNRERMKINRELHVIDSLQIPLAFEGGMSATTRLLQVSG